MYKYERVKMDSSLPIKLIELHYKKNENSIIDENKVESHWHDTLEILYPFEGDLNVIIDNKQYLVKAETIFIVNSNDVHSVQWTLSTQEYKGCCLQIDWSYLKSCYENIDDIYFKQPTDMELLQKMKAMIKGIVRSYGSKNSHIPIYINSLVSLLTFTMLDNLSVKRGQIINSRNFRQKDRMKKILLYIHENYNQDITSDKIACKFEMSNGYFVKIFKEQLEMTPKEYLSNYRLKMTADELIKSDENITDIALNNGFTNLNTFYTLFKKEYGMTPVQYQKKMRNQ